MKRIYGSCMHGSRGGAFSVLFGVALLLSITLVGIGCSEEGGDEDDWGVTLGAVFNTSGSQAGLDRASLLGAELAVERVNGEPTGLLGKKVQLVAIDGQSDTEVLNAKTEALIESHPELSALFGLSDTDLLLAAAPVAARHKLPFLTSGATSPDLSAQVPNYLFLACFGDNVQAAAGAEWAFQTLPAKRTVVLFDSTSVYTRNLKKYFEAGFRSVGGHLAEIRGYDPAVVSEQTIADLPEADLIYLAAHVAEDAVKVVQLLREAGNNKPILGGDGYDMQQFWSGHPEVAGVYFTTHAYLGKENRDSVVRTFRAAYEQANPGEEPDAFTALGYDAAGLLLNAIRTAESGDPPAVLAALAATEKYHGVTGTISFTNGSRIPTKSVAIIEVREGAYVFHGQFMPTSVPAP